MELLDEIEQQYILITQDPEYLNYNYNVFLTLCEEIKKNYPGLKFTARMRLKSENSKNIKKEKYIAKGKPLTKMYDICGARIIIGEVPENLDVIDPLTKEFLEQKDILENKTQLAQLYQEIYELGGFKSGNTKIISELVPEIIKLQQEVTANRDKIQELLFNYRYQLSAEIIDFLSVTSPALQKLGIQGVPERRKDYQNSRGYTAIHNGWESRIMPHWRMEVQALLSEYYQIATKGSASHEKRNDFKENYKQRILPEWLNTTQNLTKEQLEYFNKTLPRYTVYSVGGLYEWGLKENFMHYYENQLENLSPYAKEHIEAIFAPYSGRPVTVNPIKPKVQQTEDKER